MLGVGVLDVYAQESITVQGIVVDAESGESIPGVNIIVKGTREAMESIIGTTTDIEGQYEVRVPVELNTLVFTSVGYQAAEVNIDGRSEINVKLMQQVFQSEELIVVGYGTQTREELSGSVGSIQGARLAEQPAIQTSAALMGTIPGVQVTQTSGQPGASGASIRIRGIGTLGNSNPLVLIDGAEGNIDDIPSSDIENITVLKDASAAAIYGSRGANGVILVTTKRGNREQPLQVNYSGNTGFQYATNQPKSVDGLTFMRLENLGAENLGTQPKFSEDFIQAWITNHETDPDNYPNTNWINEVFTETAMQQKHNLAISGGGSNYTYRGSLQYDKETAEVQNFNFQRYNIRLNTDLNVSDEVSFVFDVNAIRTDQQEPAAGISLLFRETYRLDPLRLARYNNGNFGEGMGGSRNPVAEAEAGGLSTIERNIFRGRFSGIYNPVENLVFRITYAPELNSSWRKNMRKQWQAIEPETNLVLSTFPAQNSLSETFIRGNQHTANFTTEYQENIADHYFSFLGGTEYVDFSTSNFGASRDNFPLQDFEQLSAGSAENQQNFGNATQWRLLSFFGRVDYDYRNKYLFTSNLRYDASSRFTEEKRWGLFPSFSAGWRISDESFMNSFGFINDLKIRGSWGIIGNQNIGNYPFAAVVNLGQNFIFGDNVVGGAAQTSLANPNITWEETTTTNIGFDVRLFDNSLDLQFDWFTRVTEDILLQLPMPLIIGMTPPFQNAGTVKNKGWEVSAIYNNIIKTDISYSIGFNISNVDNKVVDLRGAGPFISGNSIIKEGYPINSIYGLISDGLFQSQQEIDNHASQAGNIAPGDIRYVDINGDGVIGGDDRAVIGDPFPSFNYGINISINYRNLDISALFQGIGSRDVLLQGDTVWAFQNAGTIRPWQAESFWSPDNPENTYPRLTRTTSHSNFQATDFWVYDASYLRLRNLQIGFEMPFQWTESIADRVRVYFVGQNLLTLFDNMPPGIDPNVPNNTVGNFFPVNRLYSLGIDINF